MRARRGSVHVPSGEQTGAGELSPRGQHLRGRGRRTCGVQPARGPAVWSQQALVGVCSRHSKCRLGARSKGGVCSHSPGVQTPKSRGAGTRTLHRLWGTTLSCPFWLVATWLHVCLCSCAASSPPVTALFFHLPLKDNCDCTWKIPGNRPISGFLT